MLKKRFLIILCIFTLVFGLVSCKSQPSENGKLKVIATIFPQYDFVRQIAGDKVDLSMLLDPGAEAHSFEPSPKDIINISECNLFIYVGGENDEWINGVLKNAGNVKSLKLLDCVDPIDEEIKEGMDAKVEEPEPDDHVWTSPENAIKIVNRISGILCELDKNNAEVYRENTKEYVEKLKKLDNEIKNITQNSKHKTLIFGDRFPVRYFTEEYGLDYFAAFPGCSGNTEANPATVAFLIDKVKQESIPVVLYIEFSNQKMADTICQATGAKKMMFHSGHNLTKTDFESGMTYIDIMENNIATLKEALN